MNPTQEDGRVFSQPRTLLILPFYSVAPSNAKILENSLDALVSRHEGTTILRDVRGEIDALMSQLYGNLDAIGASKAKNRSRAGDRKGAKREVRVTGSCQGSCDVSHGTKKHRYPLSRIIFTRFCQLESSIQMHSVRKLSLVLFTSNLVCHRPR